MRGEFEPKSKSVLDRRFSIALSNPLFNVAKHLAATPQSFASRVGSAASAMAETRNIAAVVVGNAIIGIERR